ncbi:cytochrome b/b6 domain-containing protein [Microbacterium sp. NPDC096154]|uniref:cytochrome b/b6 domain-containing protein n=1 Tax=Microbacterium sp. NPDC096154 TaxID=3155549 RepID=UPI003321095A
MATTVRRGLPRARGGAAWPPADFAPEAPIASPELANVAEDAPLAGAPPVARPREASTPVDVPVTTTAAPAAVRRGLPRVAGGDPWPPISSGLATAAPVDAVPVRVETPVTEPAPVLPGTPGVAPVRVVTSSTSARRGLPRTAGGEPWPPADYAPVLLVAEADPRESTPTAAPVGDHHSVPMDAVAPGPAAPVVQPPVKARPVLSPVAQRTLANAAKTGEVEPVPAPTVAWPRVLLGLLALLALGAVAFTLVFFVRFALSTGPGMDFLARYPGEYHPAVEVAEGFPAWARWQHFLNFFFMILIIRSGLQVRHEKKPPAYWASKNGKKISISLWLHQSLDILWLVNGVVFMVLIFATGHWARIVPTSWEVFPNALSAGLQYLSMDWPTENGWVNFNSLQQLAYFVTVFLAAPLAAITGVRMSGIWPKNATALSKAYPLEVARALHFPVMLYFVIFVIFHVALVFATGALRNLNHMYAGQDVVNWAGFGIMLLSVGAVVAAWIAARPVVLAPIASLFGKVSER